MAIAQTYAQFGIAIVDPNKVFSHTTLVFSLKVHPFFACLQSRCHEIWAAFFSTSLEDRRRYAPSDCFVNFAFPAALVESRLSDDANADQLSVLEAIGERYHQFRAELMIDNNEGLTSTYNRLHDPAENNERILELRSLHQQMDQAVLQAYGWDDIPTSCGFGLDYLDSDDTTLPPDLQERIASGDLFFDTASEACAFQSQLRQYGVVKPSKKLPWRHRWPDEVRDDVLARLLALNAERYAEEQSAGLHTKSKKKTLNTPAPAGSKNKGRQVFQSNIEQFGLVL